LFQIDVIFIGEIVGVEALNFPITTEDISAQVETTAGGKGYFRELVVALLFRPHFIKMFEITK